MEHLFKLAMPVFFLIHFALSEKNAVMPHNTYFKSYYDSGTLKAEGWMDGNKKTDYWYFYHPNGNVASKGSYSEDLKSGYWYFYNAQSQSLREGHYENDKKERWWIFYKKNGITRKIQFESGEKNGFCMIYQKGALIEVERYTNDKKEGSWTSVAAFKRDNPNISF